MSKDKNYIIVLGGMIIIIGIIIFGSVKYFIFGGTDISSEVLQFLLFTIPSILGTSLIIIGVLNLNEKKELKAVTKQNNEYSEKIFNQQSKFITQLATISEGIAKINSNENERNRLLLLKDGKNKKEHDNMYKRLDTIETKLDDHIENHS